LPVDIRRNISSVSRERLVRHVNSLSGRVPSWGGREKLFMLKQLHRNKWAVFAVLNIPPVN